MPIRSRITLLVLLSFHFIIFYFFWGLLGAKLLQDKVPIRRRSDGNLSGNESCHDGMSYIFAREEHCNRHGCNEIETPTCDAGETTHASSPFCPSRGRESLAERGTMRHSNGGSIVQQ